MVEVSLFSRSDFALPIPAAQSERLRYCNSTAICVGYHHFKLDLIFQK